MEEKLSGRSVQVKGGKNVGPRDIRDFAWVLNRERAQMGVFVCRNPPTKEMRGEAAETGKHRIGSKEYPKVQIVSLSAWYAGHMPDMPAALEMRVATDKSQPQRKKARRPDPSQPQFKYVFTNEELEVPAGRVLNPALLPESAVGTLEKPTLAVRSRA